MKIKNVVVIGATGTVGKTVSAIFASFGEARVYMVGHTPSKLEQARIDAALSVKAFSILDNLIPISMDNMEECIKNADLIFESVSEDINVKKEIHTKINDWAKDSCILSTGTSGLSIDDLANCYDISKRKNYIGIHFFNPPYNLTLCEIIPSIYNKENDKFIKFINSYLENVLYRKTIIVKNEPAFLANRIGFMFMNEALQYALEYKDFGGIDYIDTIIGKYTGRNMGPLETVNFVGLDIHKAIVENLYNNTNGYEQKSYVLPEFVNKLISENKLGIKTNEGLYKNIDGIKYVYDIANDDYRVKNKYDFSFIDNAISEFKYGNYKKGFEIICNDKSNEGKICLTLLLKYIVYSLELSLTLCDDIESCDIAMAEGFNWIPPTSLVELLGGSNKVVELCQEYLKKDYSKLLDRFFKSKYDYRKFIKAKV